MKLCKTTNDINKNTDCPEGVMNNSCRCGSGSVSIITPAKAAATNKKAHFPPDSDWNIYFQHSAVSVKKQWRVKYEPGFHKPTEALCFKGIPNRFDHVAVKYVVSERCLWPQIFSGTVNDDTLSIAHLCFFHPTHLSLSLFLTCVPLFSPPPLYVIYILPASAGAVTE